MLKFAGFVMTFDRPLILKESLKKIQAQTFPPEYLLVVDNSDSLETKAVMEEFFPEVGYLKMKSNLGPAGAAKEALRVLGEKGYDWIYWGDDDDPPQDSSTFENLFRKILRVEEDFGITPGIFGEKGGYFNKFTGRVRSLSNSELSGHDILEVDVVTGNHILLVNAEMLRRGVLPTAELFFGFEELDYCLKAKKNGFRIFIDAESWWKTRVKAGNDHPDHQWKNSHFGRLDLLWRDYYSSRNLLNILFKNKLYPGLLYLLFKIIIKSISGFRFGLTYGKANFKTHWKAIWDFVNHRLGPQVVKT